LSNNEGDPVSLSLATGSDPDGQSLVYSLDGMTPLPSGLSMDSTGNVTGTIDYTAAGSYTVTVIATDPEGATSSTSFTWTIYNTNQAPSQGALSDLSNNEGDPVSLSLATGSDPDGQGLVYSIESMTPLPSGLNMDEAGNVTGTIDYEAAGSYTVMVIATDPENATSSMSFTWTVGNTNQSPSQGTLSDQTSSEGDSVSLSLATGSDPDGQSLAYSLFISTPLPSGLSMDADGNVTGTIDYTAAGTYTVTVIATDPENATSSASFTWTVYNTNQAPSQGTLSDLSNNEGDSVSLSLASGNDLDAQNLTYGLDSMTPLPSGLSMDEAGNVTGTID